MTKRVSVEEAHRLAESGDAGAQRALDEYYGHSDPYGQEGLSGGSSNVLIISAVCFGLMLLAFVLTEPSGGGMGHGGYGQDMAYGQGTDLYSGRGYGGYDPYTMSSMYHSGMEPVSYGYGGYAGGGYGGW